MRYVDTLKTQSNCLCAVVTQFKVAAVEDHPTGSQHLLDIIVSAANTVVDNAGI